MNPPAHRNPTAPETPAANSFRAARNRLCKFRTLLRFLSLELQKICASAPLGHSLRGFPQKHTHNKICIKSSSPMSIRICFLKNNSQDRHTSTRTPKRHSKSYISLSDLRSSEIPVVCEVNSFPSTFLLFRVTKSPRECEKRILYKILHRLSGPIFFLAQKFPMKKIILKSGKIFSRKISNFIKAKKHFH